MKLESRVLPLLPLLRLACRDSLKMSPLGLNRNVPLGRDAVAAAVIDGDIKYER